MAEDSSDSHTVFIDTNLSTHLVMVVTDHDTVADFKKKVSIEHRGCFPDIGDITVQSLKVRRNGHFYHLLNSILVKSAFDGVNKSWFLHVDATLSQVEFTKKSKKNSRNSDQNLSKNADVKIPTQQTSKVPGAFMEMEAHNSVNDIVEGNSIPCSALGRPHGMSAAVAAVGDGDLDSLQDLDIGGASGSKLESKVDASENTSAFEGRKRKRKKTKRNQPENANETEVNMKDVGSSNPLVTSAIMETEDPDIGGASGSKLENKVDASENSSAFEGRKRKRKRKKTKRNQPENANETEVNMKDVGSSNPLVTSAIMETEDPGNKRRKKSKKNKVADLMSHPPHPISAENTVPLTSDQEKSFGDDIGTKKESSLLRTENRQLSKVCFDDNDKIEEKSVLVNEGPKMIPEAKCTMSNTRDRDVSAIDAAVSTGVQDSSVKSRKKSKKTKAPDSHGNSVKNMTSLVPDNKSSFDGDVGTNTESILFQTENSRNSEVCPHENDKIEEKSVLENEDLKMVPEAKSTMSNARDGGENAIDAAVSTKVQDPSVKKRKKSKKSEASNGERKVSTSGTEHIESSGNVSQLISKSNGPSMQDYSGIEINEEDDKLSRPDDGKVAKLESLNARGRGFDDNVCKGTGHEDASLLQTQVVRNQGSTDDVDDKVNHKAMKPSVSTSNTIMDPVMVKQIGNTENPPFLTKGKKEEEKTSKRIRKSKLKTDNSVNESCDIRQESESVGGFEAKSLQLQQLSDHVGSPQLRSNSVNCNVGGHVNESTDGANDGDEVNFKNYFVPKDISQVTTPAKELVKKDVQQTKHDKKLKVNKKAEVSNANSLSTSSDLGKPHEVIENQVHKNKTQSAIPNTIQPQRSNSESHSKDSHLHTATESLVTPLDNNDKVKAFPNKISRSKIVNSSEEIKSPHDVQFHSPSSVNVHTSSKVNSDAARTFYGKETGDAVHGSQNQKSLLDIPNKVYSESSTESYEDKGDGKHDSDATRSPSDTSSSSDHSDGESEVNLNSPGSSERNITVNGGNRSAKSQIVATKNMDLHKVLRSSKSYKKAKLRASQSQPEEDEDGAVPFDLDGHA